MINAIIDWVFYPSIIFFLDFFLKGFFLKDIVDVVLIFVITAISQKKSFTYIAYLLIMLYLLSLISSDAFSFILFMWIILLCIATYIRNVFLDSSIFPYSLLTLCFLLKIIVFRCFFNIQSSDWLYTIGQFIGNVLLLLISLKWFSAVKASGRK